MSDHKVSIVIPTFNRAQIIGETLDSVIAQTYANWECIIVDDGSTDNTAEVIHAYVKSDSRFKFVKRDISKVKGASSCRNTGLACAQGSYIIFLDSDDWLIENCVTQRMSLVESNPEFKFLVFPMQIKYAGVGTPATQNIPFSDDYVKDFLRYDLHWGIMCTLWEKKFLLSINGFNEIYPRLNDPELHIRALLASKGNFHVARDFPADSIYRLEEPKNKDSFSVKYLISVKYFVKDMVLLLNQNNRQTDRFYLKTYLLDYFLNFSYYLPFIENRRLIDISKENGIINFKEYVQLFLWSFVKRQNFRIFNFINFRMEVYIKKFLKSY